MSDLEALRRSCRHFSQLVFHYENEITETAIRLKPAAEKVLLYQLLLQNSHQSLFSWLANGQRIHTNIERGLRGLEELGALEDQIYIFQQSTISQRAHARRVLRTMLMTIELVNMAYTQIRTYDYPNKNCGGLTAFFCQIENLISFLAVRLPVSKQSANPDTMYFQRPAHDHEFQPDHFVVAFAALRRILLFYGGTGLYHISRPGPEYNIYGLSTRGRIDLNQWAESVPDEPAWENFLLDRQWFRPMTNLRQLFPQHFQRQFKPEHLRTCPSRRRV